MEESVVHIQAFPPCRDHALDNREADSSPMRARHRGPAGSISGMRRNRPTTRVTTEALKIEMLLSLLVHTCYMVSSKC